jgi:hypothetical protein
LVCTLSGLFNVPIVFSFVSSLFSHSCFTSLEILKIAGNLNALHALVKICLVVLDCIVVLVFSGLFNHDFLQPRRSGI